VNYLLESGTFTAEEIARIGQRVASGSLALQGAESFLVDLRATWSIEQAAEHLDMFPGVIKAAVVEGQILAVEIGQKLRFPTFQFNIGRPEPLIPHLSELIDTARGRWDWISTAALMRTRQSSLIAAAKQAPRDWLIDGGSFDQVGNIIESTDRR